VSRPLTAFLALACLVVAAVAVAAPLPPERDDPLLLRARGEKQLSIETTRQGRSIVTGHNLAPGETVRGRIRVWNTGSETARLRLRAARLRGQPGPNGGELANALRLRVKRARPRPLGHRRAAVVYNGRLAGLGTLRLGSWRTGRIGRFRFRVRFADGGLPSTPTSGDNAYQGSRAAVRLVWSATPA
jgi:hypothetical protein